MRKSGLLYFHQGWTDIVNQLSLINYYSKLYHHLDVIMRNDAKSLVDFYVRSLQNVSIIYCPLIAHNVCGFSLGREKYSEILFHGTYDHDRYDPYHDIVDTPGQFFVKKFYTRYGINYENRISQFSLERDNKLEEIIYSNFLQKHGADYVLKHENLAENVLLDNRLNNAVNLNQISTTFFDMIKVIENAKEIHLVDSVWAALIYHIDAKYRTFQHIPIRVFCARGYIDMFNDPVKLENWTIAL